MRHRTFVTSLTWILLLGLPGCATTVDGMAPYRETLERQGWHVPQMIRDDWRPGTILLEEDGSLSMLLPSPEVCPEAEFPRHTGRVALPSVVLSNATDDRAAATFFGDRLTAEFDRHRDAVFTIEFVDVTAESVSITRIDDALQAHENEIRRCLAKGVEGESTLWVITEALVAAKLRSTAVRQKRSSATVQGDVTQHARAEGGTSDSQSFIAETQSDKPMVIAFRARRVSAGIPTLGGGDVQSEEVSRETIDRMAQLNYEKSR
jgi:hypothetical protein